MLELARMFDPRELARLGRHLREQLTRIDTSPGGDDPANTGSQNGDREGADSGTSPGPAGGPAGDDNQNPGNGNQDSGDAPGDRRGLWIIDLPGAPPVSPANSTPKPPRSYAAHSTRWPNPVPPTTAPPTPAHLHSAAPTPSSTSFTAPSPPQLRPSPAACAPTSPSPSPGRHYSAREVRPPPPAGVNLCRPVSCAAWPVTPRSPASSSMRRASPSTSDGPTAPHPRTYAAPSSPETSAVHSRGVIGRRHGAKFTTFVIG